MIEERIATRTTRRTIVKTGVKVAYAAPLLAATLKFAPSTLAQDVCDGVDDNCSGKPIEGACWSCKTPDSGCVPIQGSAQVIDAQPTTDGGIVCVCQSNQCVLGGVTYDKGDNITAETGGTCHPVNVTGNTSVVCEPGGGGDVSGVVPD